MDNEDSLDDWIDGLSGKRPERGSQDEAAVLRQLVLAEARPAAPDILTKSPEAGQPADGQARLAQSVASMADYRAGPGEQAGNGAATEGVRPRRRIARWAWPSGLGIAAALLLSVALFEKRPDGQQYYPIEPALRGNSDQVQTLQDAHPRARAETLAGALREAGAHVDIYQHGQIYTLDIVVTPANSPAIMRVLKSAGLDAPFRSVRVQIAPQ